ncbi:MAG TPA: hypothetical protein VE978_10585 [Chitinophagales bacterium]|nr:hypothetical protein [Chitinophagales bacterium]
MRRANLLTESTSDLEKSNYSGNHPLQLFSKWFEECLPEHQIELAEFIGHFCYPELFIACETIGAKIFAFRQYLKANEGNFEQERKLLLFIDEIIEFMGEINEIVYENTLVSKEIRAEFRNIASLHFLPEELPERIRMWLITYEKWQLFKTKFSFFSDPLGYHQILQKKYSIKSADGENLIDPDILGKN